MDPVSGRKKGAPEVRFGAAFERFRPTDPPIPNLRTRARGQRRSPRSAERGDFAPLPSRFRFRECFWALIVCGRIVEPGNK